MNDWKFDNNRSWAYNFISAVAHGEKIPQTLVQDWFRATRGTMDVKVIIFQVVKDLKMDKIPAIKLYRAFTLEGLADAKQAVERNCFPVYKFIETACYHRYWSVESSAALGHINAGPDDRFRKVGENQYKLDSNSVATYIIPDRLMKLA